MVRFGTLDGCYHNISQQANGFRSNQRIIIECSCVIFKTEKPSACLEKDLDRPSFSILFQDFNRR